MYYTGFDPLKGSPVYVATDYREKQLQRALLQFNRPENAPLVREALKKAGREDLIGYSADCLVRPENLNPSRFDRTRNPSNGKKSFNRSVPSGAKASNVRHGSSKMGASQKNRTQGGYNPPKSQSFKKKK
jgi:hypothetical protein